MKEFEGNISISRSMSMDGDNEIYLKIQDESSGIQVLTAKISLEGFSRAITGQAFVPIKLEYGDLSNVGKIRVREDRSVVYPHKSEYDTKKLENWLQENCQEDGYQLNSYLGSKSSKIYLDGKLTLNYSVTKFV